MSRWNFYTAKQIKPAGWLKRQLEIQAQGLSGNLDKVWRDVRDSAWIGKDADGWERVPYWLDGFIPLAYLLENEDMISRAKKYVDAILSYQKPDGWICPCDDDKRESYDTWAIQLISKVLVVYYQCSGDERIPETVYKVMKNYHELLKSGKIKLFQWGKYRWFEAFIAINFLSERYTDGWIKELALILKEQGVDYNGLSELWKTPKNFWKLDTHIVNLVMMLKSEAVSCDVLGQDYTDAAERLWTVLKQYNGTAVGLFTGDECLSGLSPIQGTELCAVAEQMYSYEWLFAHTGDSKWAERLEELAFNALPAAISDDMWAHQYVQQANQIACRKMASHRSVFRTNNTEAHIFGLEPNFGCCTANFNQAWPKLCLSAFMGKEGEIISAVPVPSRLTTEGAEVELSTEYPFKNLLEYRVIAKKDTTLTVRVPSFAKGLRVNGNAVSAKDSLSFKVPAGESAEISVSFDTEPVMTDRPGSLKAVKCGSLVFALPISYEKKILEYEKDGVERKFPYCDYEYNPTSEWSFAYSSPFVKVEYKGISDIPFSSQNPPVVVKAKIVPIDWGFEDGYDSVCAKAPQSRTPVGEVREAELYPYGCAKLRMTELPLV